MMSTKLFSLPVCCILLITAGCGHKVDVSTAFSFPVETVKSFAERTSISSTMSEWAATQYEHAACDSLIVSFEPRESFLFSLTDLRTGDLIGTYCHKGRSDQEPLDILPHFVPYVDEGEFKIDFLSYPRAKVFSWNVTRSCRENTTEYDAIITLYPEPSEEFTPRSFFILDENVVLVLNSRQNLYAEGESDTVPVWEVYDSVSGELIRTFELFKPGEYLKEASEAFSRQSFFSSKESIKPDHTLVVSAMQSIPQINIIDPYSGDAHGILFGSSQIDTNKPKAYFYDVKCDDRFIYALYLGEKWEKADDNPQSWVYVLDWNGKPLTKFRAGNATGLFLDKSTLYLTNYMHSTLSSVDLRTILPSESTGRQ